MLQMLGMPPALLKVGPLVEHRVRFAAVQGVWRQGGCK